MKLDNAIKTQAEILEQEIKQMELDLMYGRNPTASFEDFMSLTNKFNSITKKATHHRVTNSHQRVFY